MSEQEVAPLLLEHLLEFDDLQVLQLDLFRKLFDDLLLLTKGSLHLLLNELQIVLIIVADPFELKLRRMHGFLQLRCE